MHRINWDDLRFVLAVVETGSISGAARALSVNHATVLRRVAAFEEAHGGPVFLRGGGGYEVIPERLPVIEAARLAAAAFDRVAGLMRNETAEERPIRLTSTDSLSQRLLPDVLDRLARLGVLPRIELGASNGRRNLGRLEADITVRPTRALPEDLVGLHAGDMAFAVYAARQGADAWLAPSGLLLGSVAGEWFTRQPACRVALSADSFMVLAELAARGRGRAVLPDIVGDHDPRLVRLEEWGIVASVPLWVASHVELADSPRLAHLREVLAEAIRHWRPAPPPASPPATGDRAGPVLQDAAGAVRESGRVARQGNQAAGAWQPGLSVP